MSTHSVPTSIRSDTAFGPVGFPNSVTAAEQVSVGVEAFAQRGVVAAGVFGSNVGLTFDAARAGREENGLHGR